MAFNPRLKMSMQDTATGLYYYAQLNTDATWTVRTDAGIRYIEVLPDGWDKTAVTYERDMNYVGIFRSMSSKGAYKFSMDGRAIIQYVRSLQGIQGAITLTIYIINNDWLYDVFFRSELDFKTYSNDWQDELLSIHMLDGGLIRDVHARGDTAINLAVWKNLGGTTWELDGAEIIRHSGIKLLYNATFVSSATLETPLIYGSPGGREVHGFNHGADGDGYHVIPALAQYNITQNNGTTTYIGNDILQPFLKEADQRPGADNFASESTFSGINHSQPYTSQNFSLKDLLPDNSTGAPAFIDVSVGATITMQVGSGGVGGQTGQFLALALFEIDETDNPHRESYPSGRFQINMDETGTYSRDNIFKIPLPDGTFLSGPSGTFSNYASPITVRLNYNKVYIMCIIYDSSTGVGGSGSVVIDGITDLRFSILSKYTSGAVDPATGLTSVPAPYLPQRAFAGFRLHTLLEKLVKALPTTNTDPYGFPIAVTTPYTGVSNFLSNPALPPVGDVVPYQIMISSAYCMHNLQGQSYVTASLNQLHTYCKKVLGTGATIEYDTDGNPTIFRIEDLNYIFNKDVMILDLGYDVSQFVDEELTEGLGAFLKLGYQKADTNSDFGVDAFNTELFFNTPLTNTPGTMDYQDAEILTEMYALEKIFAQRISQPIGESYNPASPSGDNTLAAFYCEPASTSISPLVMRDPSNGVAGVSSCFKVEQYPDAQNSDPAATTAKYIHGLYYPDTAINVKLSPCRALQRGIGQLLHSVLDLMEDADLTYRSVSVMQYNNQVLQETGIESNLNIGSGAAGVVNEFSDKPISGLPAQLFKPVIYKVRSKYPVNLYTILNGNPNGYVRFFWKGKGYHTKEYKMFIQKAVQSAGNNEPTDFYGWAHPDMVI